MNRRKLVTLLGGAAAAWPLAAQAQQGGRVRRIGVLMGQAADDPEGARRALAFAQGLQELGWSEGRNVRIDIRWAAGDAERYRKYAAELVVLAPDVVLGVGGTVTAALQQASRTVPIVFVTVTDPVAFGLVASLARPGGNTTGFTIFEYGFTAKWLELLKEIAPRVTRVAFMPIPPLRPGSANSPRCNLWRRRWASSLPHSLCVTRSRSSAPLPSSRARRTAA
jgi:putative ABC transport system substrate-binding protein